MRADAHDRLTHRRAAVIPGGEVAPRELERTGGRPAHRQSAFYATTPRLRRGNECQ